nr:hypothetical protein [Vallitalea pronyensis]
MTGTAGTTSYTYDDLSRLVTETNPGNITKAYTYDAANNRKTFVLKQNGVEKQSLSYTYDKLNRLQEIKENGQTVATYGYDDNGNRESLTYNAGGSSTAYQYNLANQLTQITNQKGPAAVSRFTYTYYPDGNRESKTNLSGKKQATATTDWAG